MKKILVALIACTMLSGCASIVKGKTKNINLMTSTGEEAEVNIVSASGMQTVVIPTVLSVKKADQDIAITVKETKCNKPTTTIVNNKVDVLFLGNIFSLIGSVTDAVTGAMWDYDDNIIVPINKKKSCKAIED